MVALSSPSNALTQPLRLEFSEGNKVSSHSDGLRGEARFIDFAARQGWHMYRGLDGHERCDYVVEIDGSLHRVEVKWAGTPRVTENNFYYVSIPKLDRKRFDFLFIATPTGSYWIPATAIPIGTLYIKQVGGPYHRNITRPGKYEVYRVESI